MHSLFFKLKKMVLAKKSTLRLWFSTSAAVLSAFFLAAILAAPAKRKCSVYLLHLIKSIFENRKARFTQGQYTFLYHVLIGCLQGEMLSPFLWIVLAEEIINSVFKFRFKIISYAYDIALISMHKFLEILIQI